MFNAPRIVLAVSAAVVLSVSACAAPAPAPSSAPVQSKTPTPTPTPTVAFKKYTNAELAELFESVDNAEGAPFVAMPEDQLLQGIDAAKSMISSMKVTPSACGGAALAGSFQAVQGASMAVAVARPSGSASPVQTVSLVSGLDQAKLSAIYARNKEQAKTCRHMVIEVAGQKAESSMAEVPVATATPGTFAVKATSTVGTVVATQIMVTALKGGVVITSNYVSAGNVALETKQAAETLDDIAALIK